MWWTQEWVQAAASGAEPCSAGEREPGWLLLHAQTRKEPWEAEARGEAGVVAVGDTSGRAFVNSLLHCKYLRRNLVAGTCKDLEGKVPGFLRLRDCLYETRTALAAERQQWLHPLQARYARPFPLHLSVLKNIQTVTSYLDVWNHRLS